MQQLLHKDFKPTVARLTLDLRTGTVTDQRSGRVYESVNNVVSVDYIDTNDVCHRIRLKSVKQDAERDGAGFGIKGVNLVEIEVVL